MAEGKAYFVGDPTKGRLKVSFFGPFYGSYIVYGLDKQNYQHAFVSGTELFLPVVAGQNAHCPERID